MKINHAAGQPAGAGESRPVAQLSTLLAVAEASIFFIAAEDAARVARGAYEDKIRKFERKHGRLNCGISRSKPEHAAALEYTDEAYAQYRLAKRQIYNAKRRLLTAVRRAQRGDA